jgi:Uncharacterized conserved protein, contains double-stranded beta-helix domain
MKRTDHDDYLLIFCSDGRGKLTVGANSHAIEAGDVILLPQSVAHSYRSNEGDPWSIYWIHYLGQQAADYTDYLAAPETGYSVFRLALIHIFGPHSKAYSKSPKLGTTPRHFDGL